MTHISKHNLSQNEFDQLFTKLSATVGNLNKKNSKPFMSELFGPEEQIMIVKRLCAIAMFIEGNSSYRVWQLLKLSPSTAERIRLNFECGRYKNIARIITKDTQSYKDFWNTLEVILQAGMPPRGKGRWKSVFQSSNKT